MRLIARFKSLKLFWKLFIIWSILVLISTVVDTHLYKRQEQCREEITESLYKAYKQTMTSHAAMSNSMSDAIHYPDNKEEIKKKYGIEDYWFSLGDFVVQDLKQVDKLRGITISMVLPMFFLGFIFWFGYLLFIIYKLIRGKLTNRKERFLRFIGVTIILGIVFFGYYQSSKYNRFTEAYEKEDILNNAYKTSFWGLIELSNDIYKLYEIQNESPYNQGKFLVQTAYLRKKTEALLSKLEKIPQKEAVMPAVDICKGILSFVDLYSSGKTNIEQERNEAKGLAEFRVALDKLTEYISKVRNEWGVFPPGTSLLFDSNAVEQYKVVQPDKEYSIFLWFGYYLYKGVYES